MKEILRVVQTIEVPIDKETARNRIVEARINIPGKLDCYEKCNSQQGFIYRLYTLDIPVEWDHYKKDLLDYARDNMPNNLVFGKS